MSLVDGLIVIGLCTCLGLSMQFLMYLYDQTFESNKKDKS